MLRRRRKTDIKPETVVFEAESFVKGNPVGHTPLVSAGNRWRDYFKFIIYCVLLAVPLYAITKSILKQDWLMVAIDALIVPVGFVHGLLLLFGYVN